MRINRDEEGHVLVKGELISQSDAKWMQWYLFTHFESRIKSNTELVDEIQAKITDETLLAELRKFDLIKQQTIDKIDHESPEFIINFDLGEIARILKDIISFLDNTSWEDELKEDLTTIETNAVFSYSRILWITDAQNILDDPENAHVDWEDFTFDGEYRRIAGVVQTYFPKLYGIRFQVKNSHNAFVVIPDDNKKTHTKESFEEFLNNFKAEIEGVLAWELLKIGYDMKADVRILDDEIYIAFEILD